MTVCFYCDKPAAGQCQKCGKFYCRDHGDVLCRTCSAQSGIIPDASVRSASVAPKKDSSLASQPVAEQVAPIPTALENRKPVQRSSKNSSSARHRPLGTMIGIGVAIAALVGLLYFVAGKPLIRHLQIKSLPGTIAYIWQQDLGLEPDGIHFFRQGEHWLHTTGSYSSVEFSRDGTRIEYSRPGGMCLSPDSNLIVDHGRVVPADGGDERIIAADFSYWTGCSWLPDGTAVTTFWWDGGTWKLLAIDPENGDRRVVLTLSTYTDGFPPPYVPRWSPNGNELMFFGMQTTSLSLYVVDADGTNLREVVSDDFGCRPTSAAWSPDGEYIAFACIKVAGNQIASGLSGGLFGRPDYRLYVTKATGGSPIDLLGKQEHLVVGNPTSGGSSIAWGP